MFYCPVLFMSQFPALSLISSPGCCIPVHALAPSSLQHILLFATTLPPRPPTEGTPTPGRHTWTTPSALRALGNFEAEAELRQGLYHTPQPLPSKQTGTSSKELFLGIPPAPAPNAPERFCFALRAVCVAFWCATSCVVRVTFGVSCAFRVVICVLRFWSNRGPSISGLLSHDSCAQPISVAGWLCPAVIQPPMGIEPMPIRLRSACSAN